MNKNRLSPLFIIHCKANSDSDIWVIPNHIFTSGITIATITNNLKDESISHFPQKMMCVEQHIKYEDDSYLKMAQEQHLQRKSSDAPDSI